MRVKGWLKIPGVQDGDRTLEEQMMAVRPALALCAGKTVLDLGCAEALISIEFAKAGASRILGIEREADHLEVAHRMIRSYWNIIELRHFNLKDVNADEPIPHDIVLCLSIIHKLEFPEIGMRFAARSAREWLLLRSGRGSINGIIYGKYSRNTCDSAAVMREEGFVLDRVVDGPRERKEPVEYFRRVQP